MILLECVDELYIIGGLLFVLIFISVWRILSLLNDIKIENKSSDNSTSNSIKSAVKDINTEISPKLDNLEESLQILTEGKLVNQLRDAFDGAAKLQSGEYYKVKQMLESVVVFFKDVARANSGYSNKLIGSKGIFISKETIDAFISKNIYPEIYEEIKSLLYWQEYFMRVSMTYEIDLYQKIHNIFKKSKYFISPNTVVLLAPFSRGSVDQSLSNIHDNLSIYKSNKTKAASGLIIRNADYTDHFINDPELNKYENGFLSKQLSSITTNIKIIDIGRKDILKIWNEIQSFTSFVNKELEPLLNKKNLSSDNPEFIEKVSELKEHSKNLENLILSFAKQRLIKIYNQVRELKIVFSETVESEFIDNKNKLNEWSNIYDEILIELDNYLADKMDISIIQTNKGTPFNENLHFPKEDAVDCDDVGKNEVVKVLDYGFVFNGKDDISKVILKSNVICSKY